LFFHAIYPSENLWLCSEMSEDTAPTQPVILENARVKGPGRKKGIAKIHKARPLKNLDQEVLKARLVDLQKRVRTAECKMTLLKEKLVVHEEEATLRDEPKAEAAV